MKQILGMIVILTVGLSAFGQVAATSSLSGVIVDPSGAVIPGAEVAAGNNATGAEFKTVTVENGTFSIPVLDPGAYTVTMSLPGFKQAILANVKLDAGVPGTVRVTLELGAPSETVTVAYSDSSNTQDPGGRLGQIVARINF